MKQNFFKKTVIFLVLIVLFLGLTLYVKEAKKPAPSGIVRIEDSCGGTDNKFYCWENFINDTLNSRGLDAAFDVISELYSTEPAFASECHGYVHKLGEDAYEKFARNEDIDLTPKTSYCGYGFYHGFMETLLHSGGDIDQAKEFCAYAGRTLMTQTTDAEGACYHGIGHGAVDGSDPRAWGDPEKMIEPGIRLCKMVTEPDPSIGTYYYRCITGAYNAIEILSGDPRYKLSMMKEDPFWLCPRQEESYREACYSNMLPALIRFTDTDVIRSARMIEKISESDDSYAIRSVVMLGLFHEFIRMNLSGPDYNVAEGVRICRSLDKRSVLPCVEGLSGGHMKYGEPDREYVKGLAFCSSVLLNEEEKDVCYRFILSRLRIWYSSEEAKDICRGVEGKYRERYCNY